MGISTIQSYRGAQIFEAVGLERELIDKHFTGTARGSAAWAWRCWRPRRSSATRAPTPAVPQDELLPVGGVYAWRRDGEHHMWNPETIALVQHAVRAGNGDVAAALTGEAQALEEVRASDAYAKYREYARAIRTRV